MLENNSDDDFDFDLDEIVHLNTQPTVFNASTQHGTKEVKTEDEKAKTSSVKSDGLSRSSSVQNSFTQSNSTQNSCAEPNWGSDDDDSFLQIPIEDFANPVTSQLLMKNSSSSKTLLKEKPLQKAVGSPRSKAQAPPRNEASYINLNHSRSFPKSVEEKLEAKFPGPAGLLTSISTSNQLRGHKPKVNLNLINMDGLCWWDKALSLLNVKSTWDTNKMNLSMIRKTFTPGVVYLTAPLLVLGVQRMESMAIITSDVDCIFQDPTAEAKGRILKDVITDYGKLIQAGTVLVLRRPNVLQMQTNCLVTVTKTCLIGMIPPRSNEITKCRDFTKEDLVSWLTEPVVYGDPVLRSEEASDLEPNQPPVTLFTSATAGSVVHPSGYSGSYSGIRPGIQLPAIHRPYPSPTTPSNYNRPRTPMNPTPRPSIRPPPNSAVPVRPSNGPTVRPASNNNQFQFKSPSSVVSTPHPAPYVQPNRSGSHSTPKSSTPTPKPPENVDDNYLSQFLEGIDTDSLFDDF